MYRIWVSSIRVQRFGLFNFADNFKQAERSTAWMGEGWGILSSMIKTGA
jgi:hypothetical protein